ncbi:MAG: hypothetical protein INQ03_04545 [Candidatus Heimdallarchaeota archaeon]|nr:hypothetical protein [Candidatus Heimdallarchaeota archaeon]
MSYTWTDDKNHKAQTSQTIRILLKSLQYLAEDVALAPDQSSKFVKVASKVISSTFNPSTRHNMNEQISSFLSLLGWRNCVIKLKSADVVEMILGSNRYLDQDESNIPGLEVLVKTIAVSVGSHILSRDVDALVNVDVVNKNYNINLQAISAMKPEKAEIKTSTEAIGQEVKDKPKPVSTTVAAPVTAGNYEVNQIILPIINNKMPYIKFLGLLKDVTEEFSKSWYKEVPEQSGNSDEANLAILLTYLMQKAIESGNDMIQIGNQIGSYWADAIKASFPDDEAVNQEILEGSTVGSIIRDIKARSLCTLSDSQSCGTSIGGSNRRLCDMAMGIWGGCLGKLTDKNYKFSSFFAAGKRDPYCLMEFQVT